MLSLLRLLDSGTFNREEDFQEILEANRPLVRIRDRVLQGAVDAETLDTDLKRAHKHRLLQGNRQLRALMETSWTPGELEDPEVRSKLAYRIENINLLAHAVTRTRKRDVNEWRVVREPQPEFVPMTSIEEDFYEMVTSVVISYSLKKDVNERFLLVMPQRQMASCMPAALRSWQRRAVELEAIDEEDEERAALLRNELGPLTQELAARAHSFGDPAELEAEDSKYKRLIEILREYLGKNRKEKVVLFSTFKATLAYLERRLNGDGISTILLQGGMRRTKQEVIDEFKAVGGASVLLSTEVGGEGVDLQFSRFVINYDLPWNPMRIEQRIGRVDRLGQKAEKVLIWNLFYDETIDARIYVRLYEKLRLCEEALGDFEAVLGDKIRQLEIDLLSDHLTPEQQEARIAQTAQAFENLKREHEDLENEAVHLVAYGDYILRQIRAAHELNRWIRGDDIRTYVVDFLRAYYPGCDVHKTGGQEDLFRISLSAKARVDLAEYGRRMNLVLDTYLLRPGASAVRYRFDSNTASQQSGRMETISQFHPLVRFVGDTLDRQAEQLRPAVAIRVPAARLELSPPCGTYALAVSRWSVDGLQTFERLVYKACLLGDGGTPLSDKESERLAVAAAENGVDWLDAEASVDLELAHHVANDRLFAELGEAYEEFVEDIKRQNDDRADLQRRTVVRHYQGQRTTLMAIREKHLLEGRRGLARATEGRLRSLETNLESKKAEIERRQEVKARQDEICVAIVNIEG